MDKKILHDKIYYYENVMPNFDDFNKALEHYNNWEEWTACGDVPYLYGEQKSIIPNKSDEYKSYVYNAIKDAFYNVSKDYAESLGDYDEPKLFPTYKIKKYMTGASMGAHYDQSFGDTSLRYSFVMYLNDDYEGGEISFKIVDYFEPSERPDVDPDYNEAIRLKQIDVGIKPKANSIVIFPSSAPYFHTAHIIKSNVKYMIPGHWIHNNMEFHLNEMMS